MSRCDIFGDENEWLESALGSTVSVVHVLAYFHTTVFFVAPISRPNMASTQGL